MISRQPASILTVTLPPLLNLNTWPGRRAKRVACLYCGHLFWSPAKTVRLCYFHRDEERLERRNEQRRERLGVDPWD